MQGLDDRQLDIFRKDLEGAVKQLELSLSEQQVEQLLLYLALLYKWNRTYNLTAVRDPSEMLWRHLVDALSIASYVSGPKVLDVGTGPGLPGIPLAILYPDLSFSLLDSNIKKTRFLTQSVIELKLSNVEVLHTRIEQLPRSSRYDQIVSRAFAALDKVVDLCHPYMTEQGQLLAMKGLQAKEEQEALPADFDSQFRISADVKLKVPGCEAQRHLIIIEPRSN